MSSSVYVDNKKKKILGESPTKGLDGPTLYGYLFVLLSYHIQV